LNFVTIVPFMRETAPRATPIRYEHDRTSVELETSARPGSRITQEPSRPKYRVSADDNHRLAAATIVSREMSSRMLPKLPRVRKRGSTAEAPRPSLPGRSECPPHGTWTVCGEPLRRTAATVTRSAVVIAPPQAQRRFGPWPGHYCFRVASSRLELTHQVAFAHDDYRPHRQTSGSSDKS